MRSTQDRRGFTPTPLRTRLRLESLDARCTPSSLISDTGGDPSTGAATQYVTAPPQNAAPQIINFEGVEIVGGMWEFTGDVVDETPGGLTITFGGEPVSLRNQTTTTNASGHFDVVYYVNTDGSDNGLVTAQTVDPQGLASNVAMCDIHPG